ncbi:MAG: PQQ-binding-like beta-propeller repeat protein [Cyclobacteriaceae bacterium]
MKSLGCSLFLASFLSISSSCEKQEELPFRRDTDGAVTSMPYQWKTSLSEDGTLIDGFLRHDVTYQNNVLLPVQGKEIPKFAMLSSATGEILWEWDDLYDRDKDFDFSRMYQYGQYLVFQQGERFYTLDLLTGTTVQKALRSHHIAGITGFENTYFSAVNTALEAPQPYKGSIYYGTVGYSDEKLMITPKYSYEHVDGNGMTGFISGITAFKNSNDDLLIAYGFADALPNWEGNIYAGLYNFTQKKYIFDKVPLVKNVVSYATSAPVVCEQKLLYSADRSLVCIDLLTGQRLWKKDFTEGFTFSGYIFVENMIIANNEDTYLYALDPDTGRQLWKEKSSGTSSKMAYLNGVVYFTGGGDGLLHAVDTETGKHLWRIRSPDLERNSGAWFMRRVSVVPPAKDGEKGKVITSSYLSAFCYEAAR